MQQFLLIAGCAVVLFLLMLVLSGSLRPLRWLGKLAVRLTVGVFMLFLLNVIGESFNLHIPINLATASISGILGLPGVAALVFIKLSG
ncbi:pro-sigmaK processing inhibitor BofA family protein [Sporolactobacillus sp. Y61]|jgi:inhibitor of the pro-sigma K processing machinery|uniref:Pro-sigmaK processing inhibitor BofA family protein n=1 Tax=Sporolactobacillus sp. Y61 TaxID=3160863 RepID=A0AAU8IH23_9BACL|nr:pro-sigmaK processing inhibitor BofA family protein [Sporolactobacillus sp. THM19-2]RYL94208.1 pro-sigmaK processing inhibitor BofA [Sporolactobacillus sp. THM19-2]